MTPDAVAELLIDAGAQDVERWSVAGLRSIAHLVGKSKGRCGIYVLAFANGEYYVGQAVDVTARFVTHAQTYADIAEVFVWRVPRPDLNRVEQAEIRRLQRVGVQLRNVVHAAGRLGASAFDVLVPPAEQDRWLTARPAEDTSDEPRPDDADIRRRGEHKYRKLAADPRFKPLLPALRRYLVWTVPFPRRTELTYWTVSAMPDTNKGHNPRLLTLSVQHLETCIVDWPKGQPHRTRIRINVDLPLMLARWGNLDRLMDQCPGVFAWIPDYDVRPDVLSLEVESPRQLLRLLDVDAVVAAARQLNLDLMRKGPTMHWRTHSFALVDQIWAANDSKPADDGGDDGVGLTLAKRGDAALGAEELDTAETFFREAVSHGERWALADLGALLVWQGREAVGQEYLRQAADAGDDYAMEQLGVLHEQRGDLDAATRWYRAAADAGNAEAASRLQALLGGARYRHHRGR